MRDSSEESGTATTGMPRLTALIGGPPSRGNRSATTAVVRRLERRLDEICQAMIAQLRREYPEYHDVPDHARQSDLVQTIARAFLAVARDARTLTDHERAALADIGAESARHGISLDTLIGGVRLSMRIAWLYTVDEARELEAPARGLDALEEMALTLFNFVNDLTTALDEGYEEQRQRASVAEGGPRGLLAEILRGRTMPDEELRSRAMQTGLDAFGSYGLLLVGDPHGVAGVDGLLQAAQRVAARFGGAVEVTMKGAVPMHVVVVCPAPSQSAWGKAMTLLQDEAAGEPTMLLGSRRETGLVQLGRLYRRMSSLLGLAGTVFTEGRLLRDEDLRVYQIIGGSLEERQEFINDMLGPLLALPPSRSEPLLRTLAVLYESGGRTQAAADALHVHTKTVGYRVSRIEEMTGLSLHSPADRLRLDLALHLLKLSGGIEHR
jgi:hypothetical protein